MVLEGGIHQSLCHQCNDSDQAAVAEGQLILAPPNFTEKDIVIELGKLGYEFAESFMSSCLFDHDFASLI